MRTVICFRIATVGYHQKPQRHFESGCQFDLRYGTVTAIDGTKVAPDFETLHLHGGMAQARQVAEQVRNMIPRCGSHCRAVYPGWKRIERALAFGVY